LFHRIVFLDLRYRGNQLKQTPAGFTEKVQPKLAAPFFMRERLQQNMQPEQSVTNGIAN